MRAFEDRALLVLVVAVSLAFGWILWPFYGAILWAVVGAIVFAPLYRRLSQSMRERRSLAAVAAALLIVIIVILPLTLIGRPWRRKRPAYTDGFSPANWISYGFFNRCLTRFPHGSLICSIASGLVAWPGCKTRCRPAS